MTYRRTATATATASVLTSCFENRPAAARGNKNAREIRALTDINDTAAAASIRCDTEQLDDRVFHGREHGGPRYAAATHTLQNAARERRRAVRKTCSMTLGPPKAPLLRLLRKAAR